jgi:hypothetical protein
MLKLEAVVAFILARALVVTCCPVNRNLPGKVLKIEAEFSEFSEFVWPPPQATINVAKRIPAIEKNFIWASFGQKFDDAALIEAEIGLSSVFTNWDPKPI